MAQDKAEKIVNAILADLKGRGGIGNEFDQIDREIQDEIYTELVEITRGILGN